MFKIATLGAVVAACLPLAVSQPAAAKSPFCFGGSPTPKHICDVMKANEKKKPFAQAGNTFASKPSQASQTSRVRRPLAK
jgi:hypothetical protein